MTEAVQLRMVADVPLGALLSGGVDSSVIVATMAKISNSPVSTFSIGFRNQTFDESGYARQAAEVCGTAHYPYIIDGNVQDVLPILVRHYGEPYADVSAVPSFFVCEIARNHVTVALNGDGGDELLGGYKRYWLSPMQQYLGMLPLDRSAVRKLMDTANRLRGTRDWGSRIRRKLLQKLFQQDGHHGWRFQLMYQSFWNDEQRMRLLNQSPPTSVLQHWSAEWIRKAEAWADNPTDRLLWLDNHTYLPGDLLVKMDIASMHCSLETRSPLLDHEVIEYCASLPIRFKVRHQEGKYLLKKLAERYFSPEFVYRKKMGFSVPLSDWLRGPLKHTLEDVLHDSVAMAPFDHRVVTSMLHEFLSQNGYHAFRLWALLMFGLWRLQKPLSSRL